MPQESRGAWSEERLAGWRTDPDVTTQLAALTSLDFSEHELGHGGVRIVSQREEKENQWAKENNLAHLLEHTPGLKTLSLVANESWGPTYGPAATIKLFEGVGKLTDLQTLRLQNYAKKPFFSGSEYLTIDPETTAALASALAALPHLVELDLCGNSLPPAAANVLARELQQLTGLTRLKLFCNESSFTPLTVRRHAIEYDVESGCRLLEAVGSMAGLRSFSMLGFCGPVHQDERTELIVSALGALAGLTRLEELGMDGNLFSAEAATALAGTLTRLTQLTELTMGWTSDANGNSLTSPEAVSALTAPLVALTLLTKLTTYEGPCSPATIETLASALGRMPALTCLGAGDYKDSCGPTGATALAAALRDLTRLQMLGLGCNAFGAQGAAALAPALQRLTGLTELHLANNELMHGLTGLTSLQLDDNGLRDGSTALAGALGCLTQLKSLDLSGNAIGAQGAAALATALQRLTGLTFLNLANNELMHEDDRALPLGLGVLAPALAEMTFLTHLNLYGNDITGIRRPSEFWQTFLTPCTCRHCPRCLHLDLHGNDLTGTHSEAIEQLADSLKKCTAMTALYLPHVESPGWCQHLKDSLLAMTSLARLIVGKAQPDEIDWGMALPEEITRSWMGTLKYVRELGAQGAVPCSMLRLLIIGMGEAGKTCLKQALMSDTDLSPPIATDDRTIGIDTHPSWKPGGKDLDFTVWDFAGQRGYQTGHSPFLSERCLSMLVFRPDQGACLSPVTMEASAEAIFEEWVRPWLELLHAHSPGAHVLLVCTRWMSPPAGEELGAYQMRINGICKGISQRTSAQVEAFNKATKNEVKRLVEKASKLEQELKRVEDKMQAPPPAQGGHGARRREALKRRTDLTEELEAARNRRTKLCDKRSQEAKQMQILAATEGANACADMVHLVESVKGDGSTVKSLREALVRTARGLPFVGENIPRGWLTFKEEAQTLYQKDKSILVKRDSLMSQLRRDSPQLQTWLIGREAENRVLEFWELLGFMLVTPDQEHVIVSPPKLIDLLKPLVHHQAYSDLEGSGQAHTVVENFDLLSFEEQKEIRQKFKLLEKRYILDVTLLGRLKCWALMNKKARAQALRMLRDLNLVVPHRGGAQTADEQRFLCVCRLHRDSHASVPDIPDSIKPIKISVKYTVFPILPLGLFPRFLAAQIVERDELKERQRQPRISPTSLFMTVTNVKKEKVGKEEVMLVRLNPSDSSIEVHCSSIGLLRHACCTLEKTVHTLFPGLSLSTKLRFPYKNEGIFTWSIDGNMVEGHSFGSLLEQKRWDIKMDEIESEDRREAISFETLKNILEPTLGLSASFFLSHCWGDKSKDYAKELVSMLEDLSRDLVWYDEEQLERVNHFPSKMQEGVKQAECIIIFLSRVYLSRQNCLEELQWAWEQHLLEGKSLIVLPVDEAVTVDSLREWAQPGTNLIVQEPDQGGTFTIHHKTLKFVSEKLTGFRFRKEWQDASATENQRFKAVQEIYEDVVKARAEQKEVPKKAKLKCHKLDSETWMLEELGEEDVSSLPPRTEIVDLFIQKNLIWSCERVCAALGVTTLDDLRMVKFADVEELKTTLKLTPVEIEKLRLLLCQIETPAAEQGAGNLTRKMRALSPGAKVHSEEGQKHSEPDDLTTAAVVGGAHSGDRLRIKDVALKSKFDECGLGFLCADICDEWGAKSVDDLVEITEEDIDSLSVKLRKQLKVVQRNKLKKIIGPPQDVTAPPASEVGRHGVSSLNDKRPHIVAFFAKKDTDVTYMLKQVKICAENENIDKKQMSKEMYSLIQSRVERLKLYQEAETLMFGFRHPRSLFEVQTHPQPTFKIFEDCMLNARQENTRIVHLSGHSNSRCGFFWLKDGNSTEYEQKPIEAFTKIFKTEVADARIGGTIQCVVLNACETEEVGRKLRELGVPYVVCWLSEVRDETAMRFSQEFYKALDSQKGQTDYKLAFQQATNRLDSTKSNSSEDAFSSRKPAKHKSPGARDFICLLSAAGDVYPNTGFIRAANRGESTDYPGEEECCDDQDEASGYEDVDHESTRNWREPGILADGTRVDSKTDFAALAGQEEKAVLQALEFSLLLEGKEIDSSHGLTASGFLTKDALSVLGVDDYLELWGGKVVDNSGKVVDKASLLLRSEEHSTAARDQVRKAHCKLERAVYFRQLNVMAWRKGKKDGKKDLQEFKEDLLTKSNEEIFKVYDGDCRDRELIRAGKMPEIPCEQQAAAENEHVGVDPHEISDKYRTLLEGTAQGTALQQASGATIVFLDFKKNLRIKGTSQQRGAAWKLFSRLKELDSVKSCKKTQHHFLQLDKVFEAKEALHALLLCQVCSDKGTAEGPGKFDAASDKFYCEKCWKTLEKFYCEKCWKALEEVGAAPQEANSYYFGQFLIMAVGLIFICFGRRSR